MNESIEKLQQIDTEIAQLEKLSGLENDPDKKVAYMKQIMALNQKRAPIQYNTLSEEQKYTYLEGMYAMHSKMASDSRRATNNVASSFYAKAYGLDSCCDRFFSRLNETFNIHLESQENLAHTNEEAGVTKEEDLLWDVIKKGHSRGAKQDMWDLIGKGAIYAFIGLVIFSQVILVSREGLKGLSLLLFFLFIAAPVYFYGVWKGRQQVVFTNNWLNLLASDFHRKRGNAIVLILPLIKGRYKGHEFTLKLHQTRPFGYGNINQKMVTESLLETPIPPLELPKPLNISLNLNKTDPKWLAKRNQANELLGPDLVTKILTSQQQGSLKWEIKINRTTISYAEFGPISSEKMVATFRHAFDLLALIADTIKTGHDTVSEPTSPKST